MKTCTHCGESMYEAIPKIVHEDPPPETNELGTSENDPSKFPASIFGDGSVIVIVFASIAMIAAGAAIYFYVRLRKVSSTLKNDDE